MKSIKNYTVDSYEEALKRLDFPNYKTFDDVNGTYCNFFQKIMTVIDKIAPYRNSEGLEKLNGRDKFFQKFKKSKLNIGKGSYKKLNLMPQNWSLQKN